MQENISKRISEKKIGHTTDLRVVNVFKLISPPLHISTLALSTYLVMTGLIYINRKPAKPNSVALLHDTKIVSKHEHILVFAANKVTFYLKGRKPKLPVYKSVLVKLDLF